MSEILHEPRPPGALGAVLTRRDRRAVVAHYGSAAGELAACLRSVGLALRSDLIVSTRDQNPAASADVILSAPGGIIHEGGGWFCRAPGDRRPLTLVGRPSAPIFASHGAVPAGSRLVDDLAVYNILGPRAPALLADLGLLGSTGDPRNVTPFRAAWLGRWPIHVLSQTLTNFLLLARPADADAVWRGLTDAGRRHAAAAVGIDAVERYILTECRVAGAAAVV